MMMMMKDKRKRMDGWITIIINLQKQGVQH